MRRPLLLVTFAAALLVPGSASSLDTVTQFGTAGSDFPSGVAADASGSYLVGLTDDAFPGENDGYPNDAFVAHVDPLGVLDWVDQFGGSGSDQAHGVALGTDGVFVAGHDRTAHGMSRGFVRRYGSDGTLVWSRTIRADRYVEASAVAADATGIVVFGETGGALGRHDAGRSDGFLRRYDLDGNVIWTRQFGTDRHDNSTAALAISGDIVYAVTETGGRATVYRFGANGRQAWRTDIGPVVFMEGAAADRGGVVVAGAEEARSGDPGDIDALVVALGPHRHERWRASIGEHGRDAWETARTVAIDGDRVIVTGDTRGDLTQPGYQFQVQDDAFVRILDASTGAGRRTIQFGTDGYEFGNAGALADGRLTVAGATTGTFEGETSSGFWDVYVVTFDL